MNRQYDTTPRFGPGGFGLLGLWLVATSGYDWPLFLGVLLLVGLLVTIGWFILRPMLLPTRARGV